VEVQLKLDRDKLIRARELLGYGIEKTAEEAGISKNSVLRAEHGEDIRPITARKIAAALGVTVADLYKEAEFPKAQAPLWSEDNPAERRTAESERPGPGGERISIEVTDSLRITEDIEKHLLALFRKVEERKLTPEEALKEHKEFVEAAA
jgi:transcriptional regulator with XRE-family HTH domain